MLPAIATAPPFPAPVPGYPKEKNEGSAQKAEATDSKPHTRAVSLPTINRRTTRKGVSPDVRRRTTAGMSVQAAILTQSVYLKELHVYFKITAL